MHLQTQVIRSPIGDILLAFDAEVLRALDFLDHEDRMHHFLRLHYGKVTLSPGETSLSKEIEVYFEGDLVALSRVPVQTGGTDFQRKVWDALTKIQPGATKTYSEIAREIGHPTAIRAVGAANGANPISLVIPCHRVIGADGSLTGYGGGIHRKKWLLHHESSRR
ncbi:MAG TPA: methylated-DNA--[protein]-cysteine S-methyltransferase [Bryobacteraceae bacterium]|nr:methylated-DNA--[protein]-cysteine S-methyltransferase [Bryobacteraceae bacterium]